jgi:Na+-translocating ferredoxin:NAD+ oxidoreductase RnfG subunit
LELTIIIFIASSIFALIGVIYNIHKKKIEELEAEQKEIKENYLSRFEQLHKTLNDFKIETIKELKELKILIIENKKA